MSKIFKKPVPASPSESGKSLKRSSKGNKENRLVDLEKKYAKRIENKSMGTTHLMGLVDATSSMSPVINKTKQIISELITKVSDLGNFHMNWVAYRDYCDGNDLIEHSGWHQKTKPLLDFLDKVRAFGGGDLPEAVEKALEFAVHDQKCTRIILIGDAPPHPERDYRDQASALAEQGRKVFSFVVGDYPPTIETFTEISQITGGSCHTLTNVDEILACIALTAADDIGGQKAVQRLLAGFKSEQKSLSPGVQKFADKLLNPPK